MGLLQKIAEIESRPSRLSQDQLERRRREVTDFVAISAFEGLYPSELSLKLQELFASEKMSSHEYIDLCRLHSRELLAA